MGLKRCLQYYPLRETARVGAYHLHLKRSDVLYQGGYTCRMLLVSRTVLELPDADMNAVQVVCRGIPGTRALWRVCGRLPTQRHGLCRGQGQPRESE